MMTTNAMMEALRNEPVYTWFDLGLFIDRFKDNIKHRGFDGTYEAYKQHLEKGGVAFLSFYFGVDGITIEVSQYAKIFKSLFPEIPIHFVAGAFYDEAASVLGSETKRQVIDELNGFDNWPLYNDFFHVKMQRGSQSYNALITKFWDNVLQITEKLGHYVEENHIALLYLINVNSNPGNVALALATVLVSEYLSIPVINNSHDYYWEGGMRPAERKKKNLPVGPRDFFFTNAHVGEVFSLIEVLYPWNSRAWMTVNINRLQNKHVVSQNGLNPSNVEMITTAVNPSFLKDMSKREAINAFVQVASIFSNSQNETEVHAVESYMNNDQQPEKPVLLGKEQVENIDFVNNNIIFLQPTRIISRKSIELNFVLLEKLFNSPVFREKFDENPSTKLTLLISGPIPPGQSDYYRKLLKDFLFFLDKLPEVYRKRVYLGFLFSYFDKPEYRQRFLRPITIRQLYNIASLVLLPSQTEGRGLPILEAAACGTPIFCRQYEPRTVFEEVIGYHLDENNRLKVYEFSGNYISDALLNKLIEHIFYPQNALDLILHNKKVVAQRYSVERLKHNMENIIYKHYLQLHSIVEQKKEKPYVTTLLKQYAGLCHFENEDLKDILDTSKRHYLPGYGRLAFMQMLKSLIDPSFFRVEEQLIRGMTLGYADSLLKKLPDDFSVEKTHRFLNLVETIFECEDGEYAIRHDHSFAYRHRNKRHYLYQDFTYQELLGVVNMLYTEVLKRRKQNLIVLSPKFFTDWNMALAQMTNGKTLGIDNRAILMKKLKENVPKGYFPGPYSKHELEYFVLQPVRALLGLTIEEPLTETHLSKAEMIEPFYVFVQNPSGVTEEMTELERYIMDGPEKELTLLYRFGIIRIIETKQWSNGVHFQQMGEEAIRVLRKIKEKHGFLITNGEYAAMMTDFVDIDHFHIGKAEHEITAKILGIETGQGFIQFVPAGIRTTLAYPTPVQTAKDFDTVVNSERFRYLATQIGEEKLWHIIKEDAKTQGTPIAILLEKIEQTLENKQTAENFVTVNFTGGVYDDKLPWSGVIAEMDLKRYQWRFSAYIAKDEPKNVPALIEEYKNETQKNISVNIAWNGGYILNPELVGKLGLPETYIGSPLGLLIMDGVVEAMPLFFKPAYIVYDDGTIDIRRVTIKNGFVVKYNNHQLVFDDGGYNVHRRDAVSFYDLWAPETIQGDGNIIVRLAGRVVKEVYRSKKGEEVKIIPVGITLSIPEPYFEESMFAVGNKLKIELHEDPDVPYQWTQIRYAVEAGPLLVEHAQVAIDMEQEGWKTVNSIRTQAARLDFVDMRGPKIAVGLTKDNKLKVLVVNGRIRESVGATHYDMAHILLEHGIEKAMGFDPGGSATLVVNGKMQNISPYNKRYEESIYSLPPEPRFVSNIIMGYVE